MPALRCKRCDRRQRPVHDEAPAQKDEIKEAPVVARLRLGQRHGFFVDLLARRGVKLARVGGQQRRGVVVVERSLLR